VEKRIAFVDTVGLKNKICDIKKSIMMTPDNYQKLLEIRNSRNYSL